MKRFCKENIGTATAIRLEPEEEHHLRHVLRVQDEDRVLLFDGAGCEYEAAVETGEDGHVWCRILARCQGGGELTAHVTVCQALIKGDHFDYAVQKCVEAGAVRILPFVAGRSVKIPKDPARFAQREQRIAREAARQCCRAVLPEVSGQMRFKDLLSFVRGTRTLFAYEKEHAQTVRDVLEGKPPEALTLIIGPEGGFTEEEAAELLSVGAVPVSLGPRILRAETAGLYMLAQIAYAWEC